MNLKEAKPQKTVPMKEVLASAFPISLSVVTTAHNESGNVYPFLSGVLEGVKTLGVSAEIIYIDDGSVDGTSDAVCRFEQEPIHNPTVPIRLIRHPSRRGISAALEEGIRLAKGEYVCFLPADLESLPAADIPILYEAMDPQSDVVVGWRKGRRDGKLLASKLSALLNKWLFKIDLHDANWIKLIRREKAKGLTLRSDWHRYLLPLLAHRGCKIKEVETQWHPRTYGQSKFGLKRFPISLADLIAIKFLLKYGGKPLLPFGWAAVGAFTAGMVLLAISFFSAEENLKGGVLAGVFAGFSFIFGGLCIAIALVAELLLGLNGGNGKKEMD